jgi:iron(III) transport system substrate-binding protein
MMFRNTLRRGDLHPARPGTRHSLTQAADAVSLTLYNGQHKEVGDAIAKAFEAKTGIHVNVRKGSSNQLASQVIEEGDRSPADVIYTEESPPLNNLGEQGLLAKIDDATLAVLPKNTLPATAPGWASPRGFAWWPTTRNWSTKKTCRSR